MKALTPFRAASAALIAPLLVLSGAACSGKKASPESEGAPAVQLVQSIPIETDGLAQPDLPYAKDVWLAEIRAAKESIELSQFYVAGGDPAESALEPILKALEEAGERGVKIRFLVSNDLLSEDPKSFERMKAIKNLETRVYDISKLTDGILHNKYWIFDRKKIYVGSQNLDWRALEHIHETGALIADPRLAAELGQIFEIDWLIAVTGKAPAAPPPPPSRNNLEIELVASPGAWNPPGTRPAIQALLELIASAKKSIRFQLLDYSLRPSTGSKSKQNWTEIDDALRAAARRGVRVEAILSNWNLKAPGIDHLKALQAVPNVEIRIATIPVWSKRFVPYSRVIHSKLMVVDGETLWLGTSNWSQDYFYYSRNVELIFRRPDLARTGNQIFSALWGSKYVEWLDRSKTYTPPNVSGKKTGK